MMKEQAPPAALRLAEQRVLEGWENLLCLGKHSPLAEQVEVINARLEERHQAAQQQLEDAEDDDIPRGAAPVNNPSVRIWRGDPADTSCQTTSGHDWTA